MAREYDNIADAISAVNGEVGEQSTKIADILEALEGKAGGVTEYSGEITLTERQASIGDTITLNAPNCSKLRIKAVSELDLTTGKAFFTMGYIEDSGIALGCGSNNAGTNIGGTSGAGTQYVLSGADSLLAYTVDFTNEGITLTVSKASGNTARVFQAGVKYKWIAWA